MATDVDYSAVCALLEGIVDQLIKDAQIDLLHVHGTYEYMEAEYRRRKALYDFEVMKDDPEGSNLLQALSDITGRPVLDILDAMCKRAGVPWEVQPDILADGPRLRLWDALGIEEQEAA